MSKVHLVRLVRSLVLTFLAYGVLRLFGTEHGRWWPPAMGVLEFVVDLVISYAWGRSQAAQLGPADADRLPNVFRLVRAVVIAFGAATIAEMFGAHGKLTWAITIGALEYLLDRILTLGWARSTSTDEPEVV